MDCLLLSDEINCQRTSNEILQSLVSNVAFYKLCSAKTPSGYPADNELNGLAANISCPTLFGYHIGWNQEQDGLAKLEGRIWPKIERVATVTNFITAETKTVKI